MATKDVYLLTSSRAPWRRAGLLFKSTRTPIQVDAELISKEQLKLLEQDPAVSIQKATVDTDAPAEGVETQSPQPHPAFLAAQAAEEARAKAYAEAQARAVEATREALAAGADTNPKGATGAPAPGGAAQPLGPTAGLGRQPAADGEAAGKPAVPDVTSTESAAASSDSAPAGEGSAGGASASPADPNKGGKAAATK